MNRFRTKKHKKGGDVVDDGASEVTMAPSIKKPKSKKKNALPELKPEIDISTALPDTNDFRTSLLMPNLSARFSMLREQDDPKSKIGKANDDSVLFPRRASRLNLFAHNPLTDVSEEVVSIRGVIRPPFAYASRTGSYASDAGYDSEDGLISPGGSHRSKPGEGNNMFGGRQKIYQIPIAASSSVRNFANPEPGKRDSGRALAGRARYEDDVTLSNFRDDREERKQREEAEAADWPDYSQYKDASSPASNMTGVNRGTSSSTAASNKRDSTAATSIASQNTPSRITDLNANSAILPTTSVDVAPAPSDLERVTIINKRLYGKNSEPQHFQPSKTISNANAAQRQRAGSTAISLPGKTLSLSKSAHNLNERFHRGGPVYASSSFRTASPPPSATPSGFNPLDSTVMEAKMDSTTGYGYVAPLSPPMSETEDADTYNNALQPEDWGKATTMGIFNKPQQYNESQFPQGQRQLHQGRYSPPASEDAQVVQTRSQAPVEGNFGPRSRADSAAQRQIPAGTTFQSRTRAESAAQGPSPLETNFQPRSRAESAAQPQSPSFKDLRTGSQREEFPPRRPTPPRALHTKTEGTFLGDVSGSSDEGDASPIIPRQTPTPPLRLRKPSGKAHPFRSTPNPESPEERPPSRQNLTRMYTDHSEDPQEHGELETVKEQNETDPMDDEPAVLPLSIAPPADESDSPTPGPGAGLGLSSLIRSHLRQDSDQSSIHPPPSPHAPKHSIDRTPLLNLAPQTTRTINPPASTHSNPWEFDDDFPSNSAPPAEIAPQTMGQPSMKSRARQMLEQAQALKEQEVRRAVQRAAGPPSSRPSQDSGFDRPSMDSARSGKAQRMLGDEAPRAKHEPTMTRPWQENAKIPRLLGQDAPPPIEDHPMNRNWQEGLKNKHTRGPSTETQRERDDFEKELEERRRKVQESLKEHAEGQSRSASPVAGLFENPIKPGNAFAMLKPKSSRGSLKDPSGAPQSKAMKMLGLGAATMSSRSESPKPPQDNLWKEEEEEMLRSFGKAKKAASPKMDKQIRPSEMKPPSRGPRESNDEPRENFRRPSSPPSSKSSHRDRSSSDVSSGRSKSRQGRYKDDLDKAMFEGTGSTTGAYMADEYKVPKMPVASKPSMDAIRKSPEFERSESAMSGGFRSNSRTHNGGPSGYFDSKSDLPIQSNAPPKPGFMGLPPRPSPRTPQVPGAYPSFATSTPPLFETSPAATPTSLYPPPPGTPQYPGLPSNHPKSIASRKRSVNKNIISEPTLLSSTSSVNAIQIRPSPTMPHNTHIMAPQPSPSSQSQFSPTMPPINPRRRRGTTTQTILGAFGRSGDRKNEPGSQSFQQNFQNPPIRGFREEQSTFSDEGEKRPKQGKQRLRKSSSEGGSLNARARQQASMVPSPAVPRFPEGGLVKVQGGMF